MFHNMIQKPALQKHTQFIFQNLILDILKKCYAYLPEIQIVI